MLTIVQKVCCFEQPITDTKQVNAHKLLFEHHARLKPRCLQEAGCKGLPQWQAAAAEPEAVAAVCQMEQGLRLEGGPGLPPLRRDHAGQGHGQLAFGELWSSLWPYHCHYNTMKGSLGLTAFSPCLTA